MTHPSKPPFELDVQLPVTDGEIELEILLQGPAGDQESLTSSSELATVVLPQAVNAQMFNSDPQSGDMSLTPTANRYDPASGLWLHSYRAKGVPPVAYLTLIGMLAQSRFSDTPLEKVTLRSPQLATEVIDSTQLLRLALEDEPVKAGQTPFPVDWPERALQDDGFILEFEFATRVDRAFAERLEALLNIWDHLVILGGFRLDFEEEEEFWPHFGKTAHVGPTTLTHTVEVFEAPDYALNLVLNLASALHRQGHPLESLVIE